MGTMTTRQVSNADDVIDSRDVIARIEELESDLACANCGDPIREDDNGTGGLVWVHSDYLSTVCGDDPAGSVEGEGVVAEPLVTGMDRVAAEAELRTLKDLAKGASSSGDWEYGATLIRDSYFEDYARELAEDIGAVPTEYTWPTSCIDWEQAARELRMDYWSVDFDGVTYWVR